MPVLKGQEFFDAHPQLSFSSLSTLSVGVSSIHVAVTNSYAKNSQISLSSLALFIVSDYCLILTA